jgi:hypothetical protein
MVTNSLAGEEQPANLCFWFPHFNSRSLVGAAQTTVEFLFWHRCRGRVKSGLGVKLWIPV